VIDQASCLNRSMTVIGIDPGSRITGFGIITYLGRHFKVEDFGVIKLAPQLSLPERLVLFADKFENILDSFPISAVAVESIFIAKNVQSILKLGQIRGIALMLGARKGLDIAEYSPASVKLAIVGYGRASKEQIQFMVQKILHLPEIPQPADAADALAIALSHLILLTNQRRVLQR
jgi:crossover junction endodeoxyribonuclease RuvC